MIYITGDIHGDPHRLNKEIFPEQKEMGRNDYVVILGDFGLVWEKEESKHEKWWLDWLEDKPFTTLVLDGNHDNHVALNNNYPTIEFAGGKVHEIRPHVLHLMRGEVFKFDDKKVFAFGGASSHDIKDGILDPVEDKEKIAKWNKDSTKMFRVDGVTWWKEEMPSTIEMSNGLHNLKVHDYKVDFVLTHCAAASIVAAIGQGLYEQDILTQYLQYIRDKLNFKKWFCGHYHINEQLSPKDIVLYEQIIRIA